MILEGLVMKIIKKYLYDVRVLGDMIKIKREGIVLKSTENEFENHAVLNPSIVQDGNIVHMFYRAVRNGNYSSIGYCKLEGPLKVIERSKIPILAPEYDYEKHGIEDPRIVKFNDIYYMFYMAYNGKDVVTAYAISKNLKKWEKKGPISYLISYAEAKNIFIKAKLEERYFNLDIYDKSEIDTPKNVYIWGKDSFIFPKRINGKFYLLHRVLPEVQAITFRDFKDLTKSYWKKHLSKLGESKVIDQRYWFESRAIGAGAPPIETNKGWLLIYHAIENSPNGRIYRACAALVSKNNPYKMIGRLDYPLFSPKEDYEKYGDVNNVVFPTGTAIFGDRLYIYYGAADKRIAAVSLSLNELLNELLKSS